MQVTKINADGLKHEFKVVISAGQLDEKVVARLTEVGQTVKVPGFRPGKVPMSILRQKYGNSVMGEVLEGAVNEGAGKAIEGDNLRPAMQPKIEITKFEQGGDLEFSVAVEVLPEISVMDLSSLKLTKLVADIDPAELDEALNNLASRRETSEPAPAKHTAKSGEVVVIDFLGKLDGTPFEGGKAEGYSLKLGSNTFIPGFEDQLVGAKAGDEKLVKVTFPADYQAEHLAGKDVEFEVKVNEVRKPVAATVDDELAKSVGLDTLDALKSALSEEIGRDYATMSRAHLKRALLDLLAENHSFVVPQGMVDVEFDAIWQQLEKDKAAGRLDESDKDKSDDELKGEYRTISERRVRLGLLLSEIGQKNNVQITQEDLNRAVLNEARRFPGQEHLVFQYYQKNADALNSLRAPIFEEKVIDYILELAKVEEKKVGLDELRKDPDATPEAGEAKPKKKAAPKKKAEKAASEE
ncbi:MAG TPA: trigger factor [Candidatus Sulfotelmatobacter sp.]|jgi:trigger factor|nr:trigger factor [Candidatus Sulfotelmatobacter sp.]